MQARNSIGLVLLTVSPLLAVAADEIRVNPTPHLLLGGVTHANQAFEAKTGIKVSMPDNPKGCGATVLGVNSGKLDAGVMCCPPNKDESGKLGLVASAVAKEGVVVMVHESNPVDNLTTQQVRDIYQGRITNWKEVGGDDAAISVYGYIMCSNREEPVREFLVGVRDYKKGVVGIDNEKLAASVIRVKPGTEVPKRVAADPHGIGVTATVYLPVSGAKVLRLDGVEPTLAAIADDSYPVNRYLYIVTKGYPAGPTKDYIDFLRSSEGQALLAKEGRLVQY